MACQVVGRPSQTLAEEMSAKEAARIAKQREDLGVDGIKALKEKLDLSIAANEVPAPIEVLQS